MRRLVLFAKRPRLGRVKTRLVPPLDAGQALELYRAFLDDQLRFLRRFAGSCEIELCLDGVWRAADGAPPGKVASTLQGRGDLGARLLRCFRRAAREGAGNVVVMGSDSPTLPAGHVRQAFEALEGGIPLVLAPATDGGYVLIGMREPLPALFRELPWGGAEVMRATVQRAREGGVRLRRLPRWYDVDDDAGLRRLRRELRRPELARRAPATARALARILARPAARAG